MNDNVWLTLAKKINTDCDKTTASSLPTVPTRWKKLLTSSTDGEMRQTGGDGRRNASVHVMSADGPFNLYNAVVTAADKAPPTVACW